MNWNQLAALAFLKENQEEFDYLNDSLDYNAIYRISPGFAWSDNERTLSANAKQKLKKIIMRNI